MKKFFVIYLLIFTFFALNLFAQTPHSTSFDDRPICEENQGIWRQFGNGCADYCYPKFDQFSICSQAIVYSCDCGKNRCWDGDTCADLKEYKKVFDIEQEKQQKILNESKEKRRALAKENQQAILAKLIAAKSENNPANNSEQNLPPQQEPQSPITVIDPPKTNNPQEAPIIIQTQGDGSEKQVEIPPFFAKKMAKEKANQNQNSVDKITETILPVSVEPSIPPGLPEIELPK